MRLEGKLVTIQNFFETFGISTRLRERIIEHYKLQHQFSGGVALPEGVTFLLYDAPVHLYEDMLFHMVDWRFEGIPIFTVTHATKHGCVTYSQQLFSYYSLLTACRPLCYNSYGKGNEKIFIASKHNFYP